MTRYDDYRATTKQINFILRLAGVSYLSKVPGLSMRERQGNLTKVRASQIIDQLLAEQAR